jgi:hypothetical protein
MESPYLFCFCDDYRIPDGGRRQSRWFNHSRWRCSKRLNQMLLGSHSIQKYASTYCRVCRFHKDEKDIQGCWKGEGCVSDVYDNVELLYPDAKVAAALCGGPLCLCDYPSSSSMLQLRVTVQWSLQPSRQPPGVFMTSGRSSSMVSVGQRQQGFFHSERGRSKHKYHRRKVVWNDWWPCPTRA